MRILMAFPGDPGAPGPRCNRDGPDRGRHANFYGDKFQGKKTASGEVFDKNGLTAAHKKLPFRDQGEGRSPEVGSARVA
jgi:hypothetical protein